ncbi:MAG: aminomethyl-transferring glycine dehydrogenase subunit GcvPA [Candidatus Omnitrophica bacterium]|nr:aminomethyl-transferring glycine dehydrogenase subunit GcvPA [Candidatus Omnitrophota bacterium]
MDYVANTTTQEQQMLRAIGVERFEELLSDIPASLRNPTLALPAGVAELELVSRAKALARQNRCAEELDSYLGAGMYEHHIPSVVDALANRGEFATAYTPYQAEASQGTLQAIYEYQTLICELTGMEVANASLYDGASSLAEAALVALRVTGRRRLLVSEAVHPEYRQVLRTYLDGNGWPVEEIPAPSGITDRAEIAQRLSHDVAAVIVQTPNFFGCVESLAELGEAAKRRGALFIVCAYPIALGVIQPPGVASADIVIGEGQSLGNPISYGGPTLGFFAAKQELVRRIPGRLAGRTVDAERACGYVLTLQAREQHIRRDKASSNVCTNEALLALRATIYLSALGPQGLRELALLNLQKSHYAHSRLRQIPQVTAAFAQPFFNEFVIQFADSVDTQRLEQRLLEQGILGGVSLGRWYPALKQAWLICVTETKTKAQIDRFIDTLAQNVQVAHG